MNAYHGQRLTRNALAVAASFAVIGVALLAMSPARALAEQTDPAMNAAVFEDVPAPTSAPVGPSSTIATVTLQPPPTPPTEAEIDAANGVARDPAKDIDGGIRFDDLPRQIGTRIRVLTRGQRLHTGVVRSADAKQVTISVNQRGGSATYILPREQIQRIDPR